MLQLLLVSYKNHVLKLEEHLQFLAINNEKDRGHYCYAVSE